MLSLLYVLFLIEYVYFFLLFILRFFFFFFFSSRRRHTRSLCDWSSDVCSSDLRRRPRGRRIRRDRALAVQGPRPRPAADRSEERRVGKECRSRWSPDH